DLTLGAEYFSTRGWQQMVSFRYRGLGNNFAFAHYNGLLDRGLKINGQLINQGGQDALFSGRYDISTDPFHRSRMAADMEYLSSYAYRAAFSENFNQAVSSDILSTAYGTYQANGFSYSLRADRYQGLKQLAATNVDEQEVRIFHAPSLEVTSTDHAIGSTPLLWNVDSSVAALKRVQPNFATTGMTERLDIHPQIALPLSADGWHLMASLGARETIYTRSRQTPYTSPVPVESSSGLSRSTIEFTADARPPVVERDFDSPLVRRLFGTAIRHTVAPELTYRYVTGVHAFLNTLRFDENDVASNTNEIQYGLTQRIFLRKPKTGACGDGQSDSAGAAPIPSFDAYENEQTSTPVCSNRELIRWRLTQKYFFDSNFGGAVVTGRRNIFETTLNLSGIAFLTEPRNISPLVSRLRLSPSNRFDLEWDFDLDTGARKFTSNNVLVDFHEGNFFSGFSYARLNAPGRFYTESPTGGAGVSSQVSDFNQIRALLGYGSPTRRGLGVAANAGVDLRLGTVQYGALQTSWNWDCCGISVEYRKYELGSVRNENAYRFNFTLANIGTAGNLRRAERLF
ncbi:MAG: LPS-assembly protein LptD, partial [Acidobacteriaceae bacterium]|nr:LPS-assembly protein LptD [Acidobacteriaceae bacterium]